MNTNLTFEERIEAVLSDALPADILSDNDIQELNNRVFEALSRKLTNTQFSYQVN